MAAWKAYLILLVIFAVLDLTYLGVIMHSFYDRELGELGRREGTALAPRWIASAVVYFCIPAGVILFARPLWVDKGSLLLALGWGAVYGLIVYGTYDFTNRAILEKWSLRMTLADIAWGMVLCGVSSALLYGAERLTHVPNV